MTGVLSIRNRQRVRPIDTALLRRLTLHLLRHHLDLDGFEIGVHLVAAPEMARVNRQFLGHQGSTDVITFDHGAEDTQASGGGPNHAAATPRRALHGELFISLDDALAQARRFKASWQEELARYLIHGLLHLRGHDDLAPAFRRVMKREEGRLLRQVQREFDLARLAASPRRRRPTHRP